MPIAEGVAPPLQRLAAQRLRGGEVALGVQQHAEVADGAERVRMPVAVGLECHLQRLAVQRLRLVLLALGLQLRSEAVLMDPLGGAAAGGARLKERAIVFIPPAQPARLLLLRHLG